MKLIDDLNKKFNNKYSYLKVYDVEYFSSEKTCTITFMFPEAVGTITDEQRKEIYSYLTEYLALNAKLYVKYKKSFLDKPLLVKEILNFINKSYSSASAYISEDNIKTENNNCYINITVTLAKNIYDTLDDKKFEQELTDYMKSKFCADFATSCVVGDEIDTSDEIYNQQLKKALDSRVVEKVPRYKVFDPVMLVGHEFYFEPEYLTNIKKEKQSVIVAGIVQRLEKKTFIKKGKQEKEKAYYTFILNEGKASINVVYFCAKANEDKMDKLTDATGIVIKGDVRTGFSGALTLYGKAIAFCEIPEHIYEFKQEKPEELETSYKTITPERIVILEQDMLFKTAVKYSQHVYDREFVVFDVETTGLEADTCEIIEIGAVKIKNGKILEKFQTLVKPKKPITSVITDITGIDNEMVADAPIIEDVIKDFYLFSENAVLVGYNVGFDIRFIQNAAKLVGYHFDNDVEDAMAMAREKLRLGNYKLSTVVNALNISLVGAHRAYNDALATAKAYLKLSEEA